MTTPPPTTIDLSTHGADLCDLLRCVLGIDGVRAALQRHDIDQPPSPTVSKACR